MPTMPTTTMVTIMACWEIPPEPEALDPDAPAMSPAVAEFDPELALPRLESGPAEES